MTSPIAPTHKPRASKPRASRPWDRPTPRPRPLPSLLILLMLLLLLTPASPAAAQTGPSLVIPPWLDHPHWAQTFDEPLLVTGGHTKGDDHSIKTFYYDAHGRVKFDREDSDPDFWIGYKFLTMEIGGNHPDLPGGASDVALAGALKIGQIEDWQLTLTGGAGTANDNHFRNTDAIYGIGNLNATKQTSETEAWHIGLNYDGNRTFLPDVPLPYLMYTNRVSDDLWFALGVPRSSVFWRPLEQVTLEAGYTIPYNVDGRVSYWFTESLSVFGEYKQTIDGFWVHDDDNRRLFYELSRVAVGVRWRPDATFDLAVGVGYAFDQEYSHGWDVRDTDKVAEPSDEILVFFRIQGTF